MANIPSNVSYGTVTGRFLLAYADTSDSGLEPDAVPAAGSVYFTASPIYLLDRFASPAPVTILPTVVKADLDSDGYICGYTGSRGVVLVATNDSDLNPVAWTWTVDFRLLDAAGTSYARPSFSFSLLPDATVDLTTVSPVPAANGVYYAIGPAGPATVLSVSSTTTGDPGTNASVTISGTAPTQSLAFTIPRGNTGATGNGIVSIVKTSTVGLVDTYTITYTDTTTNTFNVTNGAKGDTGAQGAGYNGITSSTSNPIGLGSKTFSLNKIGALSIGERIRATDTAVITNYAEGQITAISGNDITVLFEHTSGTGTISSWNIAVTGDRGVQGPPGTLAGLEVDAPITYIGGKVGFDWTSTSIDDLGNVSAALPSNGNLLKYNSTTSLWEKTNTIDGGTA